MSGLGYPLTAPLRLALVLGLLLGTLPALHADPERPDPPQSRVKIYDADPITCRPDVIEAGFRSHMAPWADQPPEVQQRLRLLQGEMTRNSLRRCVSKGLLTAEQAAAVERRLGLSPAGAAAGPASGSQAAPSSTRP